MINTAKKERVMNLGLSSLLIIFLILCLTTFALLTLSSAKRDATFSEKLASHRRNYYTASGIAEELLAQIDVILENERQQLPSEGTFFIDEYEITAGHENGIPTLSYQIPLEHDQVLLVKLEITDHAEATGYYHILTWQVTNE